MTEARRAAAEPPDLESELWLCWRSGAYRYRADLIPK